MQNLFSNILELLSKTYAIAAVIALLTKMGDSFINALNGRRFFWGGKMFSTNQINYIDSLLATYAAEEFSYYIAYTNTNTSYYSTEPDLYIIFSTSLITSTGRSTITSLIISFEYTDNSKENG